MASLESIKELGQNGGGYFGANSAHPFSKATGLEENTLRTIVQLDIERNKVSNVLVFAPQYMNVLQVNLDLITAYPKIYQEITTITSEVT